MFEWHGAKICDVIQWNRISSYVQNFKSANL